MSTGFATAPDGTTIAYQDRAATPATPAAGEPGNRTAEERPPLLLLSGQANNHHWWDPVRGDFQAHYRTVSLDYRGTGQSGKPDEPYSTQGFAEDSLAVLDHLGVDRAHVYGTSMGGRVAQWLAARHPGRVHRLVLGCTTPGGPHAAERDKTIRAALAAPDPAAARRTLLELLYTPAWLAEHPGPYTTLGDPDMPAYARARHLTASNRHNAWDVLPDIQAETLVVHGADDTFNPAVNAPLLVDRIPHATLHMIPGARHAYFEEYRRIASPLVLDFLQQADSGVN